LGLRHAAPGYGEPADTRDPAPMASRF